MANPKRRHSHARTRWRRAHDHLEPANLRVCRHCGARMLPHRVCPKCGYYRAHKWHRPVISLSTE